MSETSRMTSIVIVGTLVYAAKRAFEEPEREEEAEEVGLRSAVTDRHVRSSSRNMSLSSSSKLN